MTKKRTALPDSEQDELDQFGRQVEAALKNYHHVHKLGQQSWLASPYVLGQTYQAADDKAPIEAQCGKALQSVLFKTSEQLLPQHRQLLDLAYFKRSRIRNNTGIAMELGLTDRTYYRAKKDAIQALSSALIRVLRPTLKLETPYSKDITISHQVLERCLRPLRNCQVVAITGPSGVGKTSLGATIAKAWGKSPQQVFWLTIRTDFNDSLNHLITALAHFLSINNATGTWQQLLQDKGEIRLERILGLLRHDLTSTKDQSLLVCIDEVDLLQDERDQHAEVIHLLEELAHLIPLLLVGQRLVFPVDHHQVLSGLAQDETASILKRSGLTKLSESSQKRLHSLTRGNPALINLFIGLHNVGEDINSDLLKLKIFPSIEVLFNRIWRRLQEEERQLLMQLSIFQGNTPHSVWQIHKKTLNRLQQLELINLTPSGSLALSPYVTRLARLHIPPEDMVVLQHKAARIREALGEYTSAAQHYIEGQNPSYALWLWFIHRETEIEHGQIANGLNLLSAIYPEQLSDQRDHDILRIARSELLKLKGKPEEANIELGALSKSASQSMRVYVHELQGDLLTMQSQGEQALTQYRNALDELLGITQAKEAKLYTKLSYLYQTYLRDLRQAKQEAQRAKISAELFDGSVEEQIGNFDLARQCYQNAQTLAEKLNTTDSNLDIFSRIYSSLGRLSLKQGLTDEAIEFLTCAIDNDTQRGDVVTPLFHRINLSHLYVEIGNYDQALVQAQLGLSVAQTMRHSHLIAGLAVCAGEAYFFRNDLEAAEHWLGVSLSQEEIFFRGWALTVYARWFAAQNRFTEAVKASNEAIQTAKAMEDKYDEAYSWCALGESYKKMGQIQKAQEAYNYALTLYSELGISKEITKVRQALESLVTYP